MKTFAEIVREYFPDASPYEVDYMIWGKTSFPSFWGADDTEACLRKQLQEFKDELGKKRRLKCRHSQ